MILYMGGRYRLAVAGLALGLFLFGCFLVGVFSVRDSVHGALLIAAMFSLVVYWAKREAMVGVALFWAFAALPAGLHVGKVVGPGVINAYQVALLLAICYLLPVVKLRFADYLLPGLLTLTVLFFTVVGVVTGHAADIVMFESTTLLEMVGGYILALLVVYGGYVKGVVRTMVLILWFSAGMAVVSSLHAVRLAGRAENLTGTDAGDALRIIVATQSPAVAVLAGLAAAAVVGQIRPAVFLALGPPALIITLLSVSRNTLIALAVATIVALLASFRWSSLSRVVALAVITALVAVVTVAATLFVLRDSSSGVWLAKQFAAFNHRVLGGVSTGALAVDTSTLDRLQEIRNLNRAIARAPVFGHGLGYVYQLPSGDDEFSTKYQPTYSHNFYLWWWVKAGAVGMVVFTLFALTPLIRALRRASAPAKISAAVSAALLAISAVWPLPEMPIDALALGLALGATTAFAGMASTGRDGARIGVNPAPAYAAARV